MRQVDRQADRKGDRWPDVENMTEKCCQRRFTACVSYIRTRNHSKKSYFKRVGLLQEAGVYLVLFSRLLVCNLIFGMSRFISVTVKSMRMRALVCLSLIHI